MGVEERRRDRRGVEKRSIWTPSPHPAPPPPPHGESQNCMYVKTRLHPDSDDAATESIRVFCITVIACTADTDPSGDGGALWMHLVDCSQSGPCLCLYLPLSWFLHTHTHTHLPPHPLCQRSADATSLSKVVNSVTSICQPLHLFPHCSLLLCVWYRFIMVIQAAF